MKAAKEIIKEKCGIKSTLDMKNIELEKRDKLIGELKQEGLSTRQLERLTGISRAIILRV